MDELERSCEKFIVIDEFEENPSYELIKSIANQISSNNIETVIAIGGGSTIDSAKAAVWFAAGEKPSATKVIAVPTTAGTGSEVTPYAILTNNDGKKQILNHKSIFPDIALCDPELTVTMPRSVTANTGLDALCHAVEAYLSVKCQGFMDELALGSCQMVYDNLLNVMKNPDDIKSRERMLLASLQGGMVLARCGTVMVHALGYGLTEKFGYAHGHANAILLAGFVSRLAQKGSLRAKEVMKIFDGRLAHFINKCGIDTRLPEGSVSEELLEKWIESGYQSYGRVNCVVRIEREDTAFTLENAIQ